VFSAESVPPATQTLSLHGHTFISAPVIHSELLLCKMTLVACTLIMNWCVVILKLCKQLKTWLFLSRCTLLITNGLQSPPPGTELLQTGYDTSTLQLTNRITEYITYGTNTLIWQKIRSIYLYIYVFFVLAPQRFSRRLFPPRREVGLKGGRSRSDEGKVDEQSNDVIHLYTEVRMSHQHSYLSVSPTVLPGWRPAPLKSPPATL